MICFDTNPVIWGVQQKAKPTQKHMVERTTRYIRQLRDDRKEIMIPAPVLHEYLLGLKLEEMKEALEHFESHFFIAAFDARTALIAAELSNDKRLLKESAKMKVSTAKFKGRRSNRSNCAASPSRDDYFQRPAYVDARPGSD